MSFAFYNMFFSVHKCYVFSTSAAESGEASCEVKAAVAVSVELKSQSTQGFTVAEYVICFLQYVLFGT